MIFRQLFDPASSTYTYLLADDASHEAVIIDPVIEQVDRDLRLLAEQGLKLKFTLDTHVHADHITAARALKEATSAATAVARDCVAAGYDRLLEDGDVILFGSEEIVVIATPGHTPGSLCYLWRDRLFTGDTLLIGGCGRTDFQNGSAEALWSSVTEKLFTLDEQTLVYPGHDYKGRRVSTIGEEKLFNARFSGRNREQFLDLMENLDLALPKRIHEAVPANLGGGSERAGGLQPDPGVKRMNVSSRQLAELMKRGPVRLIDVRTRAEFEALRIANSINVPLDEIDGAALLLQLGGEAPVYCVCQTGTRSQIAARSLRESGFSQVVHVDGGTNAWLAAQLPVERAVSA